MPEQRSTTRWVTTLALTLLCAGLVVTSMLIGPHGSRQRRTNKPVLELTWCKSKLDVCENTLTLQAQSCEEKIEYWKTWREREVRALEHMAATSHETNKERDTVCQSKIEHWIWKWKEETKVKESCRKQLEAKQNAPAEGR